MMSSQILTWWAQIAAWSACAFLGMRANMLKPKFSTSWDVSPPTVVWVALMVQSMVLAGAAISLAAGGIVKAEAREAVVYTSCAISSGVMLWNLMRQQIQASNRATT